MPLTRSGIWYADHRDPTMHRTPVLLIHGAGGSHLDWPAELRRMPEANALAPDLPGHGRSKGPGRTTISAYAGELIALLDELGLRQAILLGFSMGAAVALTMALHHKARVAGLILIGAGARLAVDSALLNGLQNDRETAVRQLIDQQWAEDAGEQMKRLSLRRLLDTDAETLVNDYKAVNAFDMRDQITRIHTPTLIIGGTADRMVPFAESEFMNQRIDGSKLVRIEGSGHFMALEQPQAVAEAVQSWLMEMDS